jgi:hypothetical protein
MEESDGAFEGHLADYHLPGNLLGAGRACCHWHGRCLVWVDEPIAQRVPTGQEGCGARSLRRGYGRHAEGSEAMEMKEVFEKLTKLEYQVSELRENAREVKERIERLKEKMDRAG